MNRIRYSVRDFALPSPRTGSIEAYSGYGKALVEGIEIHMRVQAQRAKDYESYRSEMKLTGEFERGEYLFEIGGRVDGLYENDPPHIEEIKSCFSVSDLEKKLTQYEDVHPYCLQLKMYGYLLWLERKVHPTLSFHLVSTRGGESRNKEIPFDPQEIEAWLDRRLDELVEETQASEARAERRRKIAGKMEFPFERPRPSQIELMQAIEEGIGESRRMLVQAPTGLGKTIGVLYPTLKEALSRGQRVVYVTPKNSQHSVAEEAVDRLQETGAKVKSLTITAKSKICFKNEPVCNPDYCEYARGHYSKVAAHRIPELLETKRKLTSRVFRTLGEEFEVCPFELQLEAAKQADVVICDYNYVFAPRAGFAAISGSTVGQEGKPNLVIDEAHNLFARALGYFSPEVSTYTLERMRPAIRELPPRFVGEAERLLDGCLDTIAACRPPNAKQPAVIDPPSEYFHAQEVELRSFLARYLEAGFEIPAKDVVLRLCFYWSEFTNALDFVAEPKRPEFFTTFRPDSGNGGTVRITCCDASEMLKASYDAYDQVVAFSATLKPFDYYAKLSGLDPEKILTREFPSPFPKSHRKLLIIPEVSTKYADRERNYRKIATAVSRIGGVRRGNYFVFFPSFEFLEQVLAVFEPPVGSVVLRQQRDMKLKEIEDVIEHLRNQTKPAFVFAVQGGVFSEGVDYPGETVIGAFIVGPPLPNFDLEREKLRAYYQDNHGAGFDYAYCYPAMAKAVQAAGRVVRSETDRGLIVLLDSRFVTPTYTRSMPADWFDTHPQELVSSSILKDVEAFWNSLE